MQENTPKLILGTQRSLSVLPDLLTKTKANAKNDPEADFRYTTIFVFARIDPPTKTKESTQKCPKPSLGTQRYVSFFLILIPKLTQTQKTIPKLILGTQRYFVLFISSLIHVVGHTC